MKIQRKIVYAVMSNMACMVFACGFLLSCGTAQNTVTQTSTGQVCNVKNFGAVGNGTQKDTVALQNAIDTCAKQGGGKVELPDGNYLSAPLFLRSGITLQVDTGAKLQASQDPADYRVPAHITVATPILAFINAYNIKNIAITGGGVIDGNGSSWWGVAAYKDASKRPRLIELALVDTIAVSNITLQNAASMHLFLSVTNNVTVTQVTIKAPANSPNTDGIDPATSHNVTIDHCIIGTGDDNIAIKSGRVDPKYPDGATSNITIKNSQFLSGHGVSIGSEMEGGVKNVSVSDSTFEGTTNGLRIKTTRIIGGNVEEVTYHHLVMKNVVHPIIFSGYYPKIPLTDTAQPVTVTTPYYHNITVDDLVATGAKDGGDIVGVPEKPFTDIALNHVHITAGTGLVVGNTTLTTSDTTVTVSKGDAYVMVANAHINK